MKPSELTGKGPFTGSRLKDIEYNLEKFTQKVFFFLTEPTSGTLSFVWSSFMALLVVLIAVFYVLATCDGPNHYTNRKNLASYSGLPDEATYDIIDIVLWTPLMVDTFFRCIMLIAIFNLPGAYEIADDFADDTFKKWLHVFDILSTFPFVLGSVINLDNENINEFVVLALRGFYLLSCSKILRVTKDFTSVLAVRLALGKSMHHLVIPLFFFLVFNIFFGVVIYFLEPCYDVDVCAWKNLFEACFFSVVTMTTTGYGNQVPRYVPARTVSTIIMLFGSLFMAMPLAIIGNEYENAWVELKERLRNDEMEQMANVVDSKLKEESERKKKESERTEEGTEEGIEEPPPRKSLITDDENNFLKRRRMLRKRLSTVKVDESSDVLTDESLMSPLVDSTENLTRVMGDLRGVLDSSKKMNPSLLLLMCELKGWLAPVQWNIKQCMKELSGTDNIEAEASAPNGSRKLSFFRPVNNGFVDQEASFRERLAASVNKVSPGRVGNDVEGVGDEHKADPITSNTRGVSLGSVMEEDVTVRPEETAPAQGVGSETSEQSNRMTPQSPGLFSALKWRVKAVTPQKEDESGRSVSMDSVGSLQSGHTPSSRAIGMGLDSSKGITRGRSFAMKMVRAAPDIANKSTAEGFSAKMDRALDNPDSFRTRMWLLLEFPHSSKGARFLQLFLLLIILLSVLMLYTQTVPTFGSYGESAKICGEVLHVYCPNKRDSSLDPGCFVHDANGLTAERLRFGCNDYNCFGSGYNFGAADSNVTCVDDGQPFQTAEQLAFNHRVPDFLVSRDEMHKIHNVCLRVECTAVEGEVNGNFLWIPVECFVSFCFTLEIILRIFVADSLYHFCWDFLNVFDMLSVVPFYIDVIQMLFYATPLDFRILSSSPEPVIIVAMKSFKVFRLFKMSRHFSASKVLFETANKALSQILGIISLLLFIVLMFALFLYEVEKGTECFVGDADCELPEGYDHLYREGQRVLINKVGDVTAFKTVLESLWFSIVTLTSVGYGDFTPITNLGQLISIVLMLFGAIYLAMPLTVAAATFWSVHQAYVAGNAKSKEVKSKKLVSAQFCEKITALETSFDSVTKMLGDFFADIQSPNSAQEKKDNQSLLQRCLQIDGTLRSAMRKHDGDIRRLSAFTISNKARFMKDNKE